MSLTNSDLISISSVIIAVCAFFISIWQGYVARVHNYLSIKPHVDVDFNKEIQTCLSLVLKNCGLGPAFITEFTIKINDKRFNLLRQNSFTELMKVLSDDQPVAYQNNVINKNTPIEANGLNETFRIPIAKNNPSTINSINNNLKKSKIKITYTCLYNKKYKFLLNCNDMFN